LSIFWSHPRWIVSALREALVGDGVDPHDIEQLLEVDNEAPGVTLVVRPGRCSIDELLEIEGATPGVWSPYAVYLGHGSPGDISAVRQRRAAVQDEGSQLIAIALADARPGEELRLRNAQTGRALQGRATAPGVVTATVAACGTAD